LSFADFYAAQFRYRLIRSKRIAGFERRIESLVSERRAERSDRIVPAVHRRLTRLITQRQKGPEEPCRALGELFVNARQDEALQRPDDAVHMQHARRIAPVRSIYEVIQPLPKQVPRTIHLT